MFGKNRKNSPGSDAGNLVYADAQAAQTAPRRRLRGLLSAVAALLLVAVVVMAGTAMQYRFREKQDRYDLAQTLLQDKKYAAAEAEFEALGNFRDSQAQTARLAQLQADYDTALELVEQQRYEEAAAAFRSLGDYADSAEWAAYRVTYRKALDLITEIDVGKTQLLTRILSDQVRLTDENSYPTTVGYEAAAALLESLGDYAAAPALMDRCYYSAGLVKLGWKDWDGALAYMEKMTPDTAMEFFEEYQQHYSDYENEEGQ